MSAPEVGLDAEELMHLTMRAMDADRSEEAITYLKRALALAPDDGRLHFLLGAMHAEIGLDERAIGELTRATQLAPELHTAHFQLGTLLLERGEVDRATEAWRPLEMRELLAKTEALLVEEGRVGVGNTSPLERDDEAAQHVLLAGYRRPPDAAR